MADDKSVEDQQCLRQHHAAGIRTVAPATKPRAIATLVPSDATRRSSSAVLAKASSRLWHGPPCSRSRKSASAVRTPPGVPSPSAALRAGTVHRSGTAPSRTAGPRMMAKGDWPIVGRPPSCLCDTRPSRCCAPRRRYSPGQCGFRPTARIGGGCRDGNRQSFGGSWDIHPARINANGPRRGNGTGPGRAIDNTIPQHAIGQLL